MNPHRDGYGSLENWSLADCLRVLNRRKATLLGLTCLGILLATVLSTLQTPVYRASAALEIRAFNESFLDLRDVYPTTTPAGETAIYMQTQATALESDALLQQVASKLHLDVYPEYRDARGVVSRLRQDIHIIAVRNSRIIQIVCDARSGVLAADIANGLAQTFVEQSVEERQAAARQTYDSLVPQLEELRRSVRPARASGFQPSFGPDANRRIYDSMLQEAYRAWFAMHLPASNIRLLAPAESPLTSHRPNWALNLAIGTAAGLLLAIGVIMLQEQHRFVLSVPGEATTYLELPELGAIPQASRWAPFGIFVPGSGSRKVRIDQAALDQSPGLSESFRATVASIVSADRNGSSARVIVVTSSEATEGKTTIVSNLGIALAAISRKVLLIDGDMRRPRLHKLLDEANSWGLSDLLREKNAVDQLPLDVLAKKTQIPRLYVLPSGASTDNIFGLLYSPRMSRLLPLFREEFDYILVDAPPCLEFADARIMARYAEELLLVVRANHTDCRRVQAAVQRLRLDGIPLLGVILNRWDPRFGDPYSYQATRPLIRQEIS